MNKEFIGKEYARNRRADSSNLVDYLRHRSLQANMTMRYGHDAGDQVLKAVGNIFKRVREYDCVARWGGEEFILFLPDTDQKTP